jgi:pimeloyl-ACP methyl ester carboxylesterase
VDTRLPIIRTLLLLSVCLSAVQYAGAQAARIGESSPSQDLYFDSNGIKLRYQLTGQGPPVVLIHGFGETLERWQSGNVVRVLSPHFQLIIIDVRGHGRSGKPHAPKSYGPELAADVGRLLRHLGKTRAHIVGYSMGALIALDLAVLHPNAVLSVVLAGAGLIPPETLADFSQQADGYEQGRIPAGPGGDAKALAALLRGLRSLSEDDVRRIGVPVAVVIGTQDRFMSHVQRLTRVLPNVQVTKIPNADHATLPNEPQFAEALLVILKQNR